MNTTLLTAIHTALNAGLPSDLASARQELVRMGVRPSAVDRLANFTASDLPALAARGVLNIKIDYEALANLPTPTELAELYLKRNASNEMLESILGLSAREVALLRASLNIAAVSGRPPSLTEDAVAKVSELNQALAHLPLAERLLAIHNRQPFWPLASIYAVVRT